MSAFKTLQKQKAANAKLNEQLEEAVVSGDHGSPANIASGESTGAVTNKGAETLDKKKKKVEEGNDDNEQVEDKEMANEPAKKKSLDEAISDMNELNESIEVADDSPSVTLIHSLVEPLVYNDLFAVQPTTKPRATAFYQRNIVEGDDGSGWKSVGFELHRTESDVESIKLKTTITHEAIQDLNALGLGTNPILNSVAQNLADEINTILIGRLASVLSDGNAIDISSHVGESDFARGRALYGALHTRLQAVEADPLCGYPASSVSAGKSSFDLLLASGMAELLVGRKSVAILNSGLTVIKDEAHDTRIMLIAKHEFGELQVAPVVFCPMVVDGGFVTTFETLDPKSLQPAYGFMLRHAAIPTLTDQAWDGVQLIDWDNLPTNPKPMKSHYGKSITVTL